MSDKPFNYKGFDIFYKFENFGGIYCYQCTAIDTAVVGFGLTTKMFDSRNEALENIKIQIDMIFILEGVE